MTVIELDFSDDIDHYLIYFGGNQIGTLPYRQVAHGGFARRVTYSPRHSRWAQPKSFKPYWTVDKSQHLAYQFPTRKEALRKFRASPNLRKAGEHYGWRIIHVKVETMDSWTDSPLKQLAWCADK